MRSEEFPLMSYSQAYAAAPTAELPRFVRRCKHQQIRCRQHSRKLGEIVRLTTAFQEHFSAFCEVTHGVVFYRPWPGPVMLHPRGIEPIEYWPQMEVRFENGVRTFVDAKYKVDEEDRRDLRLEQLLEKALNLMDVGLLVLPEADLFTDPYLKVAQTIMRNASYVSGEHVHGRELQRLAARPGGVVMGELRVECGQNGVAEACDLVVRRRLKLVRSEPGFEALRIVSVTTGAPA